MRLEKLEVHGFKSFADKQEFEFEPGITAIVGPNGCGKSNVMDAIKWLLGEQSAKSLRGKDMSDVIFSGSSTRPAVSYAEASLTISNEEGILPIEYKTITITRRLYASGESEYLINKNLCRLKDIRELFLGTGVGVNSYSIIEQGKVEALLQANAQERRVVFEEAAGISKYKAKKREALGKLDKTQQNLLRLCDIIREVESRLRSIKIQATKARNYEEYCARYKELKIKFSLKNFKELRGMKEDALEELNQIANDCGTVISTIDSMEVEAIDFESQLNDIDNKISEANSEVISLDAQVTNVQDKINFNKEKLNDIESRELTYNDDIKNINEKLALIESSLIDAKRELEEVGRETGADNEQLQTRTTEFDQMKLELDMLAQDLEENKSGIMDIFHNQSKTQNEIGNQTTLCETIRARKSKIENRQNELTDQISIADINIQELKDKHAGLVGENRDLENRRDDLKEAISVLNNEISDFENEISDLEKDRNGKQSRLDVLEDYETRSEGVNAGAKTVLNESDGDAGSISGVRGMVADIVKVDLEYARAIETALGEYVQGVVIDSYNESSKAINFLKEKNAGYATFLLLDKINQLEPGNCIVSNEVGSTPIEDCSYAGSQRPAEGYLSTGVGSVPIESCSYAGSQRQAAAYLSTGVGSTPIEDCSYAGSHTQSVDAQSTDYNQQPEVDNGIIGKASELVAYAGEYKTLVNHLLSKTLIARDFEKASLLADAIFAAGGDNNCINEKYGDIVRVVSLDGSLIERPGIIKGGVVLEKQGLISRKSEIDSLRVEIAQIDENVITLRDDKEQKTEILNEKELQLDALSSEVERSNIALINNENDQKQEEQKRAGLDDEKNVITSEHDDITQNIKNIEDRNQELRDQLANLNERHGELELKVNQVTTQLEEKESAKASLHDEITSLKVTIAQKIEKKETLLQSVQQLESNDSEYKSRLDSIHKSMEECGVKKENTTKEIEEFEISLETIHSRKSETAELLTTLGHDREDVWGNLSNVKANVEEQKIKHKSLETRSHELRLKENEYNVKAEDLEERIYEEYGERLSELVEARRSVKSVLNAGTESPGETCLIEAGNTTENIGETCNTSENIGDAGNEGPVEPEIDDERDSQPAELQNNENGFNEEAEEDFDDADEELDWDAVKVEIDDLKRKIDRVGSVNLDAIQEQEELELRSDFLTTQHDDLEKAEKSLNEIIEKLNETCKDLFEKTFNDIRENFKVYFRKLFGGGKSDIVIEEGVDVLDAGIEIVVQPPNKEFKSISLFSGGEKVMITVALLFSILKAKPTPFCLMDEIDAALDESNVGRFTSVLAEFAQESQFVIVTHNKKTMTAASAIYGVTMEEPGVSKKVSVKFDKFEE